MSDERAIGVFDSGVGGLTVVRELFMALPAERIIYFGDTARVPYGTKSAKAVTRFALEDIFFLLKQEVKIVVAACHTVSSVALDDIVQTLHVPVLGVVEPGVKAAAAATRNGKIGVIGTRATILSRAYEQKLKAKDPDIEIFGQSCPLFVPLTEEGWLEGDITRRVADIYLAPLLGKGMDTLILGCTHYPLLKPVIQSIVGPDVIIIDSAEETARLVASRLQGLNMQRKEADHSADHVFYVSDIPHQFRSVGECFLGRSLENLIQIDLDSMNLESAGMERMSLK